MRIESLQKQLAEFPDIDGVWHLDNFNAIQNEIHSKLSQQEVSSQKYFDLSTQLVRVLSLMGQMSESQGVIDKLLSDAKIAGDHLAARSSIRLLIEESRLLCLGRMPSRAQSLLQRAWQLAQSEKEDFFAIEAAFILSAIIPARQKAEWLQKALTLAKNSKDLKVRSWLPHIYLMNGWHQFDHLQYEEALKSFTLSTEGLTEPQDQDQIDVRLWSKARCLRAMGRTDESLEIQKSLNDRYNQNFKTNGFIFLEIGECLQLLQKHDEAQTYFQWAHKELSSEGWYSDNNQSELERMVHLGKRR